MSAVTNRCPHTPPCPGVDAPDRTAARVIFDHLAEQGWGLLCNGIVIFTDHAGELVPGGRPPNSGAGTYQG
jgi:hypothetical protein